MGAKNSRTFESERGKPVIDLSGIPCSKFWTVLLGDMHSGRNVAETLIVRNCTMTDTELESLTRALQQTKIVRVDISDNPNLTLSGLQYFALGIPFTQVKEVASDGLHHVALAVRSTLFQAACAAEKSMISGAAPGGGMVSRGLPVVASEAVLQALAEQSASSMAPTTAIAASEETTAGESQLAQLTTSGSSPKSDSQSAGPASPMLVPSVSSVLTSRKGPMTTEAGPSSPPTRQDALDAARARAVRAETELAQAQALLEQHREAAAIVSYAVAERDEANTALRDAEGRVAALEAESSAQRRRIVEYQTRVTFLEDARVRARENEGVVRARADSAEAAQARVLELEIQLAQTNFTAEEATRQLATLQSDFAAVEAQLHGRLETAQQEARAAVSSLMQTAERLTATEGSLLAVQAQAREASTRADGAGSEMRRLRELLAAEQMERATVGATVRESEAAVARMTDERNAAVAERDAAAAQLAEATAQRAASDERADTALARAETAMADARRQGMAAATAVTELRVEVAALARRAEVAEDLLQRIDNCCRICMERRFSVALTCGHCFCVQCLDEWDERHPDHDQCVTCNQPTRRNRITLFLDDNDNA